MKEKILKDKSGRENYREKVRINNLINEAEDKKTLLLIEMGTLSYQKIRDGYLRDDDFNEISNEIIELDKFIYKSNLELEKLESLNRINKCECGNTIKDQDKFCSVCGKNVEDIYEEETIICDLCETEIDADSNYCVCCGKKVELNY
ncbi:zinc ribbon domain-containing protein [Romboutsia sp. Marseille-P6047]|nr:zinc ribbon domain-containing protein [Romboutsia sp. Marseille-P6047]